MSPEIIVLIVAALGQIVRNEMIFRKNGLNGKNGGNGTIRAMEKKLDKLCNGTMTRLTDDIDEMDRRQVEKDKADAIAQQRIIGILHGIKESVERLNK